MSTAKKGLGVLFVWCVILLVGEGILRVLGYGAFIIYAADEDLLWVPRPNQVGKTVVGREPITINDLGLRYRSDSGTWAKNEHRIFAFGDSVTMGWGVDDESHYCAQLEDRLRRRKPEGRFRVVSAGVNAYPISLCVRRFVAMTKSGEKIDTAILGYSFNGGHEPLADLKGDDRRDFLRKVRLKSLVRRSAVYNFVIEDLLRQAVYYKIRDRLVEGSWALDERDRVADLNHYVSALEAMRSECERLDVTLIFVLFGSKGQVTDLSDRQSGFVKFAESHRIPVVNMIDAQRRYDHEGLYLDHVHPNAQGHLLIAQSLCPVVLGAPVEQD